MFSRRLASRLTFATHSSAVARSLSTSSAFAAAKRAPSLSDVEPDKGHEFDQRSQQFRDDLVAAHKKRDELESESVITA